MSHHFIRFSHVCHTYPNGRQALSDVSFHITRRQIMRLVKQFDHTLLIVTHDMEMAAEICERAIVLNDGKVVADADIDTVFGDTALLEACSLEAPCICRHTSQTP